MKCDSATMFNGQSVRFSMDEAGPARSRRLPCIKVTVDANRRSSVGLWQTELRERRGLRAVGMTLPSFDRAIGSDSSR
jgi:hypothetical protein